MELVIIISIAVSFLASWLTVRKWIGKAPEIGILGFDMNKPGLPKVAEMGGIGIVFGFGIHPEGQLEVGCEDSDLHGGAVVRIFGDVGCETPGLIPPVRGSGTCPDPTSPRGPGRSEHVSCGIGAPGDRGCVWKRFSAPPHHPAHHGSFEVKRLPPFCWCSSAFPESRPFR